MEFKFCVYEEPFKPFVFPVGFFVSHEESGEFRVRKLGSFGMIEPILETACHTEEFELVHGGYGLFIEHMCHLLCF